MTVQLQDHWTGSIRRPRGSRCDLGVDLPAQNKERVWTRDISFEEAKKGGKRAIAGRIMKAYGFAFNIGSLKNNGTWSLTCKKKKDGCPVAGILSADETEANLNISFSLS